MANITRPFLRQDYTLNIRLYDAGISVELLYPRCSKKGAQKVALFLFESASDDVPTATFYSFKTDANIKAQAVFTTGTIAWLLYIKIPGLLPVRIKPSTKVLLSPTGPVTVAHVYKEGLLCKSRLRYTDYEDIIPNSAFTHSNALAGYKAPMVRELDHWIGNGIPCWVAVDLGQPIYLYKITTLFAHIPGKGYFYIYTFQLHPHLEGETSFTTYEEDNVPKVFQRHEQPETPKGIVNTLASPVLGQVFKVEPLSGSTTFIGVYFLLYGCETGIPQSSSSDVKKPQGPLFQVTDIIDGDTGTCFSVAANEYVSIRTGVTGNSSTLKLKVTTKRETVCTAGYDGSEIYAMTKKIPPLRSLLGLFRKCEFLDQFEKSGLYVQIFDCQCVYGVCAGTYLRVQPPCLLGICDVRLIPSICKHSIGILREYNLMVTNRIKGKKNINPELSKNARAAIIKIIVHPAFLKEI